MVLSKNTIIQYIVWAFLLGNYTVTEIKGQSDVPFFGNEVQQRFNLQEFDSTLKEVDSKNRLMCEKWCKDKIITLLDTLELTYNYDFDQSIFYINMNENVFAVKADFIRSFLIGDKTFIRYTRPNSSETMIFEQLVSGKYTLLKHYKVEYKKPNFDPLLNMGSKVGTYKKSFDYYAFCEEELIDIPEKSKKALKRLHQRCEAPNNVKAGGNLKKLFEDLNQVIN